MLLRDVTIMRMLLMLLLWWHSLLVRIKIGIVTTLIDVLMMTHVHGRG